MSPHKKVDVIYIVEQIGACYHYRCFTPGATLGDMGYEIKLTSNLTEEMIKDAAIFVFQRPTRGDILRVMDMIRDEGGISVVEIDDDFWNIPESNPSHYVWNKETRNKLESAISKADYVTTTTRPLAAILSQFNTDVRILPNCLLDGIWGPPINKITRKFTVGWAGSMTHWDDLEMLKPVIENLAIKYPKVDFVFAGMSHLPFKQKDNIKLAKPVKIDDYPWLLAQFNVGLAPVKDVAFNYSKSDLKFLEYAAMGVPAVVSGISTYDTCEHGVTGFRANTPGEWFEYISKLINNRNLRTQIGTAARQYAETRFISKNVYMWQEAYGLKSI